MREFLRCKLYSLRHDLDVWLDKRCRDLAYRMPARLRVWVVVDSTNRARLLYPAADGFAGPDGLAFEHIYDGARREVGPNAERLKLMLERDDALRTAKWAAKPGEAEQRRRAYRLPGSPCAPSRRFDDPGHATFADDAGMPESDAPPLRQDRPQ